MEQRVQIRAASLTESGAINQIILASKQSWGYDADFMALVAPDLILGPNDFKRGQVLVYVEGGRISGVAAWRVLSPSQSELTHLFIAPHRRGAMLGTHLLRTVLSEARSVGLKTVSIEADPYAASFYLRVGAKQTGERCSTRIAGRKLPIFGLDLT